MPGNYEARSDPELAAAVTGTNSVRTQSFDVAGTLDCCRSSNNDARIGIKVVGHKAGDSLSNRALTRREMLNLLFSFLAWACTICNVNLGR